MQLVDRNGVFKNWNTLKHEYDLQNTLYFQWMQLISSIPSNQTSIKNIDINTLATTEHYLIEKSRVLTIQKVSLKLYWILITTTEHKQTSQKNSLI